MGKRLELLVQPEKKKGGEGEGSKTRYFKAFFFFFFFGVEDIYILNRFEPRISALPHLLYQSIK